MIETSEHSHGEYEGLMRNMEGLHKHSPTAKKEISDEYTRFVAEHGPAEPQNNLVIKTEVNELSVRVTASEKV